MVFPHAAAQGMVGKPEWYYTQGTNGMSAKGLRISKSTLTSRAKAPALDEPGFARLAGEVERHCRMSKVLDAAITLDAMLV